MSTVASKNASPPKRTSAPAIGSRGWFVRAAKLMLASRLNRMTGGVIELHDGEETTTFGSGGELRAALMIHDPAFFRHVLSGGSLSAAESYLGGDWDCDNLTDFFRVFIRNIDATDRLDRGPSLLANWVRRTYHAWHGNSKRGSRRNVHAHYDLGNDFFGLMLDETMSYSSGIFASEESTLREASVEKMDRICQKLELSPSDHLLEIGAGWGGLAMYAARQYGCRVTATTISREQFEFAQKRIDDAGLSGRVTLLLADYRDLHGQYDKLASCEMVEAVGHRYLDVFFRMCSNLLKPHGSFVLQAIVMPDWRHSRYLRSVDFIQRYVFPGGCLPSVSAMLSAMSRSTDLRLVHAEDFGPHYARTLREWRRRFTSNLNSIRALGGSDRFVRLWRYYLCYCEAAFEERYTGVVQLQFDKPRCRRSASVSPVPTAHKRFLSWPSPLRR